MIQPKWGCVVKRYIWNCNSWLKNKFDKLSPAFEDESGKTYLRNVIQVGGRTRQCVPPPTCKQLSRSSRSHLILSNQSMVSLVCPGEMLCLALTTLAVSLVGVTGQEWNLDLCKGRTTHWEYNGHSYLYSGNITDTIPVSWQNKYPNRKIICVGICKSEHKINPPNFKASYQNVAKSRRS